MAALFAICPDAVAATRELADRLQFTMADLGYRFPDYPVPAGETQASFLRKIVEVGARERYRPYHDRARAQIARELDLIEKLELAGYFLIVWDIVNFCRQHDILVQGRGSAANSAVCYSLGITAVDPVGMDLLFERFLSEERGEWPDIDLDLPSGDRRERVIQYVYEKYGRLGAAMTANVITYRGRSAAREVGKVLGFDAAQIDRLAKVMNHFEFADPADTLARQMASVGLDAEADARAPVRVAVAADAGSAAASRAAFRRDGHLPGAARRVRAARKREHARPRRRAVGQGRLRRHGDREGGSARPRHDGGAAGRHRAGQSDAIGLSPRAPRALSPCEPRALSPRLDLAHLPPDDPAVYRMLQAADTIGVFQVESRAQMATLPRLKPATFYDLVVEVAIIRPGPIVGQMVHPYLNRRAGREPVVYPHPSLEPILKRTLGVPLFQEQLLRIAMVAAGFTGGQAEELRRAMGFKRSEKRMKQIEGQLREGMAKKGITGDAAEQIVLSIASFALYGFPESHAASFALLAYASAYLKVHYPAAFYTALLNNQPMGFYHPSTLVKDAQRRGVRFQPIDVQVSAWDCTVEADGAIRLGLRYVSGLRQEPAGRSARGLRAARHATGRDPRARSAENPARCCRIPPVSQVRLRRSVHARADRQRRPVLQRLLVRSGGAARAPRAASPRSTTSSRARACAATRSSRWPTSARSTASATIAARRSGRPSAPCAPRASSSTKRPRRSRIPPSRIPIRIPTPQSRIPTPNAPLRPMTEAERLVADYAGTGLSIGRHPMALRRDDLAMRGVLRASDLGAARQGRRVRVAGMVITRQRPGTAKGFVFLTLEDETGVANIIVRPDLFASDRLVIVEEPFLLVDGVLQHQDGVISVRAERVQGMPGVAVDFDAHDFY